MLEKYFTAIWVCYVLFALLAIVALNIDYHIRRRKMTPEERQAEDDEMRIPGDW